MRNSLFLFLFMLAINSCMDRLSFDVGELETGILVVDGQITDEPGPYTVRLLVYIDASRTPPPEWE